MKFKFSKEWCEQAAKTEKGVGGLMACNPKYLKENKVKKAKKLTKEQKDCIQGKVKKIKGLAEVIKSQEDFIEQIKLTLIFLKMYEGNPVDFEMLIGKDIWEFYKFDIGVQNPEWMWESIEELSCDIINGGKFFKVTSNGIFSVIHFSKSKSKSFEKDFEHLKKFGSEGEWHI